jgi:hypothetical protein
MYWIYFQPLYITIFTHNIIYWICFYLHVPIMLAQCKVIYHGIHLYLGVYVEGNNIKDGLLHLVNYNEVMFSDRSWMILSIFLCPAYWGNYLKRLNQPSATILFSSWFTLPTSTFCKKIKSNHRKEPSSIS